MTEGAGARVTRLNPDNHATTYTDATTRPKRTAYTKGKNLKVTPADRDAAFASIFNQILDHRAELRVCALKIKKVKSLRGAKDIADTMLGLL